MGMVGYMSLDELTLTSCTRVKSLLRGALGQPPQPQNVECGRWLIRWEVRASIAAAFCYYISRNLSNHPLSRVLHEPVVKFPEFLGT